MKDITDYESIIAALETENQYLKKLLDEAGISYLNKEPSMEKYIEDQGSLIIPKEIISKEDIQMRTQCVRN